MFDIIENESFLSLIPGKARKHIREEAETLAASLKAQAREKGREVSPSGIYHVANVLAAGIHCYLKEDLKREHYNTPTIYKMVFNATDDKIFHPVAFRLIESELKKCP